MKSYRMSLYINPNPPPSIYPHLGPKENVVEKYKVNTYRSFDRDHLDLYLGGGIMWRSGSPRLW